MKKFILILSVCLCLKSANASEQYTIDNYLSGRALNNIEGIWQYYSDSLGSQKVAIYKYGSGYTLMHLSGRAEHNTSLYGSGGYYKGTCPVYEMSEWTGKPKKTHPGQTLKLNQLSDDSVSYSCDYFVYGYTGSVTSTFNRVWPNNLKTHNAKFKKKLPSNSSGSRSVASAAGTAFFITSKGHLITNHHVVDGCKNNSKIIYNKKDISAKLIAKDKLLDLALLKVDLKKTDHIILSDDPPKKLQRIIAAGYPLGKSLSDDLKFTSGIISSLKGLGDDSTLIQIDAALNKGNSGGPIVDEETGELVGVAVSGLSKAKTEAVNFGIKTSSLRNFLDSNQIKIPSSTLFSFGGPEVSEILEKSTVYTFCK